MSRGTVGPIGEHLVGEERLISLLHPPSYLTSPVSPTTITLQGMQLVLEEGESEAEAKANAAETLRFDAGARRRSGMARSIYAAGVVIQMQHIQILTRGRLRSRPPTSMNECGLSLSHPRMSGCMVTVDASVSPAFVVAVCCCGSYRRQLSLSSSTKEKRNHLLLNLFLLRTGMIANPAKMEH